MSLELAMENLAVAMNRQAAILEKIAEAGVAFVATSAQLPDGAAVVSTDKPATGGKRGRPASKPADTTAAAANNTDAEEPDPWADEGSEDEAPTYTSADIRDLLLKVRDKGGERKNSDAAKAILTKLGVKSPSEIKEADFAKAADLCNKAMAAK